MGVRFPPPPLRSALAVCVTAALLAAGAGAATARPLPPSPARAAVTPAHAAPIGRRVAGALGTVVLIHGGGWAGTDPGRQRQLLYWPGHMLVRAHWNVVSIDYRRGYGGFADVRGQVAAVRRAAPHGRVCLFGESAGGHLALLLAARAAWSRCVVAAVAPVDLDAWGSVATQQRTSHPNWLRSYRKNVILNLGRSVPAWFEPAAQGDRIRGDVLYVEQPDDLIIPGDDQARRMVCTRPSTELYRTRPDPGGRAFMHGHLGAGGRRLLERRVLRFLESVSWGPVAPPGPAAPAPGCP